MNKWPKHLPYPISWLRAIIVSGLYGFCVSEGMSTIQRPGDVIPLVLFSWMFQLPAIAYLHHWLILALDWIAQWWPQWALGYSKFQERLIQKTEQQQIKLFSPTKASWQEGINALIVLLAVGIATVVFWGVCYKITGPDVARDFRKFIFKMMWLVGPVIIAYLYQYDFWARARRAAKLAKQAEKLAKEKEAAKRKATKKTSSKPKKSQPPADPIEVELNQLSADFGVTAMRPVRKTPNPEQAQWYVFRSGQAEGPYTREQLWLAQRITARTNVRRESETDWTRAGAIPELADFIRTD